MATLHRLSPQISELLDKLKATVQKGTDDRIKIRIADICDGNEKFAVWSANWLARYEFATPEQRRLAGEIEELAVGVIDA